MTSDTFIDGAMSHRGLSYYALFRRSHLSQGARLALRKRFEARVLKRRLPPAIVRALDRAGNFPF